MNNCLSRVCLKEEIYKLLVLFRAAYRLNLLRKNSAKKVLSEKIRNLQVLVKDGAEQSPNKRWLRFKEGRNKGGMGYEKGDMVYVTG